MYVRRCGDSVAVSDSVFGKDGRRSRLVGGREKLTLKTTRSPVDCSGEFQWPRMVQDGRVAGSVRCGDGRENGWRTLCVMAQGRLVEGGGRKGFGDQGSYVGKDPSYF